MIAKKKSNLKMNYKFFNHLNNCSYWMKTNSYKNNTQGLNLLKINIKNQKLMNILRHSNIKIEINLEKLSLID